jgi:hypothetical protein
LAYTAALVLVSMVAIGTTHVIAYLVLSGIGMLVRRAFGLRDANLTDWFLAFWMGLAATTWFLLLWHFAAAVNELACAVVVAAGTFGIALSRRELVRGLRAAWSEHRRLVLGLIVLGLWVANLAMGPLWRLDDSIGYHLQSIRWARHAAIVPGLANLHGPLGFTSGSSLYFALLQASPWGDFAHHVGASTLAVVMLAQSVTAMFFVVADAASPSRLFSLFFLPAVFALLSPKITTVTTDIPVLVVMLAAFSVFYRYLGRRDLGTQEAAYDVVTATTLLTLGVCFKFSTSIVAGLAWLLIVGHWIRSSHARRDLRVKVLTWAAVFSVGLGLTWMARSVVLSGYPMFPNGFGAMPVPWRVPAEHALAELEFIVHSGRATAHLLGEVPGIERFSVWFPLWAPRLVRENLFDIVVPAIVSVVAGLAYVGLTRRGSVPGLVSRGWLCTLPVAPGVLAWVVVAPEPRYVRYLFWTLAAVCCAQAVRVAGERVRGLPVLALAGSWAILGVAAVVLTNMRASPQRTAFAAVVSANLNRVPIGPRTANGAPPGRLYVTRSGLELFVPSAVHVRHCVNGPLVCTPNPAPNLRLLKPGDPTGGFAVDGEWQMLDWPSQRLANLLPALRALR